MAIYPVAVGLSSRYFRERRVLQQLARDTGGDVFYLNSMDNPRRVYDRIARELREQYRLTYAPSEPSGDGEWRQIEVKLAQAPGSKQRKLRARPGYWAQ